MSEKESQGRKPKPAGASGSGPKKQPKHSVDNRYRPREGGDRQRYEGYHVDRKTVKKRQRRKPWFWKILGISLLITAVVLVGMSFFLLHKDRENARAIEEINRANTMEALLEGHKNVNIIRSYAHLVTGSPYTVTRQVRELKNGELFSYLKQEDSDEDYKEVIDDGELFRNMDGFSYYYGLIGDDYKSVCLTEIEDSVFQGDSEDTVETSKEREETTTMKLTHEIKDGEEYVTVYGFEPGQVVEKVLTLNNDTNLVVSAEERVEDEVFSSYSVEFDKKDKVPNFYKKIKKKDSKRTVKVYSDYNGEDGKEYKFTFPTDIYFKLLDHKGYKAFTDEEGTQEFSEFQIQTQNPESDLTLYVKPEEKK